MVLGCPGDPDPCDGHDDAEAVPRLDKDGYDDVGAVPRLDPLKRCARRNRGVCDSSLLERVGPP